MKSIKVSMQTIDMWENEFIRSYEEEELVTRSKLELDQAAFYGLFNEADKSPPCSQATTDVVSTQTQSYGSGFTYSQGSSIGCGPLPDLDFDELLDVELPDSCVENFQDLAQLCSGGELKEEDQKVADILNEFLSDPQLTKHLAVLDDGTDLGLDTPTSATMTAILHPPIPSNQQIINQTTEALTSQPLPEMIPNTCGDFMGTTGVQDQDQNISLDPVQLMINQGTVLGMEDNESEGGNLTESDLLDEEDTEAMGIFDEALRRAHAQRELEQLVGGVEMGVVEVTSWEAMEAGTSGEVPQAINQSSNNFLQVPPPPQSQTRHTFSPSPSEMSNYSSSDESISSASALQQVVDSPIYFNPPKNVVAGKSNSRKRKVDSDQDSEYSPSISSSGAKKRGTATSKRRRSSNESDVNKKRYQNKDAASRYRQRKKETLTSMEQEEQALESVKTKLVEEASRLEMEVRITANLLMARGDIGQDWFKLLEKKIKAAMK